MAKEGSPPLFPPHLHTIFVDSNIDTHLALLVSLHDTIGDVKCKIRTEHALCFPNIGEIAIQAIKVRRRGFLYNLADSICVLNVFDGVKGSWFVCIDALPICPVKDQKVLTNKVTDGPPEHHDYALPICDTGQEIALCVLPPKNPDAVMNMLLAKDSNTVMTSTSAEHENHKLFDTSLKELPAEDGTSLQNGNISPSQNLLVSSTDLLNPSDRSITALNGMKVNEAYLQEGVAVSQFEPEKISGIDGQGSHNPIVTSINLSHRPDTLFESSNAMPSSTCTNKTKARKRGKKFKDGFHEELLDDYTREAKLIRSEDNDESFKSVNLPLEINGDGKKEILATSERSLRKLPHENTMALLNPPVEKLTKKRKRKSSKLHEVAHLAMPTETLVVRSSQVAADSHTSGKEGTASIFLGKYSTALFNDKPLSNDDRDLNIAFDTANLLEVSNEKKFGHVTGTCLNKENIKVQTLQVNPVKRRKKDVHLGQETNLDVNHKEPEDAILFLQVASDIQTKLSCSSSNLENLSRKVLSRDETIDHQNKKIDAVKCITDLNLREDEGGSVDAKARISASEKPSSYQEQALNLLSKDSSSDKHQGLDKEINDNPEGANSERFLAQVNSKVSSRSRRSKKMSKTESLKILDPKQVKINGAHFDPDGAEVFLSDVPNDSDATIFIKQANQKVNGVHSLDNMNELSSSSKKLSNQDLVPPMTSDNPQISVPHNLRKKSNASVKIAAKLNVSLQPASEVQVKQRRSRKKSKSELSNLRSPKNNDFVLSEFNGKVTESNERKGSDLSKLENLSNQKIEPHCIDAKVIDPFSHVDSTRLVNAHQVNPLNSPSCKLLDLKGLSNAETIIKEGDVAQHDNLASPTNSKYGRKKSKKEKLKARVSSEMREHLEHHRPDNSSVKFVPKEVEHHPDLQSTTNHPPRKSDTKRKHRATRKTDINQSYQDCPTNLAQPSLHKQDKVTCQPQVNDTNQQKLHKATGQSQDDDKSHYNAVDASQDSETKDYMAENACKGKKTKQSSKHNSSSARIESDSSLIKSHDNQMREKMLLDYEPQSLVQPSKSGDVFNKQEKKITADGKGETRPLAPQIGKLRHDHGINNTVSKVGVLLQNERKSSTISNTVCDAHGSNIFNFSLSKGMADVEASSDSTKDTQDHSIQYRLVRKIRRSSKKIITNTNPEKLLSVSSGRVFSDGASSNCESGSSKNKAAIRTDIDGLSTYGNSDSHLEEMQIKTNALKLQMETSFSDAESDKGGEVGNNTYGKVDDRSRIAGSTQKNLKRSSSYEKDRLTVSQLEFADTESPAVDVVLETQLELAA